MLAAIGEEHLEEDAMALWYAALSSGLSTCPGLLELFGRLVQLLEAGPDNLEVFMPLPCIAVSFCLSILSVATLFFVQQQRLMLQDCQRCSVHYSCLSLFGCQHVSVSF